MLLERGHEVNPRLGERVLYCAAVRLFDYMSAVDFI